MRCETVSLGSHRIDVYSLNTAVVGSGAAGLNAADHLYSLCQTDIAIVTEGFYLGTSRNTGSDKQTYYKLTLAGDVHDSVADMAQNLFDGGSMQGDIALVEAALSAQCFYRLVGIGVPFPHNRFGEFVGYKTDHDPRQRATSAGPLTSKFMTEKLSDQVISKGIKIFDGFQVIKILTDSNRTRTLGLLALNLKELRDPHKRYAVFNCTNVIYATGGPAGIYESSVYPECQIGATGIALDAGALGVNLTESQYGIASIKFRWNLSGTYQQVLPRYISTRADGTDEREFLTEYFDSPGHMLDAIFLKGYQWPFDPRKISDFGSSLIDILVYNETVIKGRRVFLDYTRNPEWGSVGGELDFSLLGAEAFEYLRKSDALFGSPISRLMHMNRPAVDLYKNHGIDIESEYLEIAVCAQHNNGGLQGDIWWESNLRNFFPVGEVNGSHGVYRPGGSALNSGQVGSTRAAQYISSRYGQDPPDTGSFLTAVSSQLEEKFTWAENCLSRLGSESNIADFRRDIGRRMSKSGANIRSRSGSLQEAAEAKHILESLPGILKLADISELGWAFRICDLLITQYVYLSAIADYIDQGGESRGSYLIENPRGALPLPGLPECFRYTLDQGKLQSYRQEVSYVNGRCAFEWVKVKPVPTDSGWFETVWNAYRSGEVIGEDL